MMAQFGPNSTVQSGDIDLTAGFFPFDFSQGPRPLCLAFAVSSAHKIVRACGTHYSPEALWYTCFKNGQTQPGGTSVAAMASAVSSAGQPLLEFWPYDPTLAHGTENIPLVAKAEKWHSATLVDVPLLWGGQANIEKALAEGSPVVVAIELSEEFNFVAGNAIVAVPDSIPEPQGLHAVLIVGASWDTGVGRTYRILNSWGNDWADGGYTWLPALYLDKYAAIAAALN
jgi:C1A family cysteine protease